MRIGNCDMHRGTGKLELLWFLGVIMQQNGKEGTNEKNTTIVWDTSENFNMLVIVTVI